MILKYTTKPEANTSSILTLASQDLTCATQNSPHQCKSLELNNITALNLETISGHEASLVSTRQVENLAKQAKVDPKFLNIKTAPEAFKEDSTELPSINLTNYYCWARRKRCVQKIVLG